jgi:hypothetical protein
MTKANINMNTQEIEDQIKSTLEAIQLGVAKDTENVLFAIGTLGKKLGYEVHGLRDHFQPEWLYDLCWYSNSPDGKLLNVTLVLESEWDIKRADIKYDFEKLLIAKANIKVFVFQAKSQNVANYLKELEQGIHAYKGGCSGEIYLLACYDYINDELEIIKVAGV